MQGGIDCSGFICEVLRSVGLVGNKEDLTAQDLFDKFERDGSNGVSGMGVLCFYGESVTKITHVSLMLDSFRIIEAGGGDSTTHKIEDASQRNAMVRIRLVNYRGDLIAKIKPRYSTVGVI